MARPQSLNKSREMDTAPHVAPKSETMLKRYRFGCEPFTFAPGIVKTCRGICSTAEYVVFCDYVHKKIHLFNHDLKHKKTLHVPHAPFQAIPWENGLLCSDPKGGVLFFVDTDNGKTHIFLSERKLYKPNLLTLRSHNSFYMRDDDKLLMYHDRQWKTLAIANNIYGITALNGDVMAYSATDRTVLRVAPSGKIKKTKLKGISSPQKGSGYIYYNMAHFVVQTNVLHKFDMNGDMVFKTLLPASGYFNISRFSNIRVNNKSILLAYDISKCLVFYLKLS